MKKLKILLFSVMAIFLPYAVHAQVTLTNPLGETDIRVIAATVIKGVLSISGTLALLMFIYGGLLWLTDMGGGKRVKQGKDILIWTTLGIILIAGAYALTEALFSAITTGSA